MKEGLQAPVSISGFTLFPMVGAPGPMWTFPGGESLSVEKAFLPKDPSGGLSSDLRGCKASSGVPDLLSQDVGRCWVPHPHRVPPLSFLLWSGLSCRLTALSQTLSF